MPTNFPVDGIENLSDRLSTGAIITASAALLVFSAGRFIDLVLAWDQRRRERDRYLTALYAEIDFNTRDMEIFLRDQKSIEAVAQAVELDLALIPHITDARHTEIYSNNIASIAWVGRRLVGRIVLFYGLLEKLKAQVEGVYSPSFTLISGKGRAATIREIADTAKECRSVGTWLLWRFRTKYPRLRLRRLPRTR